MTHSDDGPRAPVHAWQAYLFFVSLVEEITR